MFIYVQLCLIILLYYIFFISICLCLFSLFANINEWTWIIYFFKQTNMNNKTRSFIRSCPFVCSDKLNEQTLTCPCSGSFGSFTALRSVNIDYLFRRKTTMFFHVSDTSSHTYVCRHRNQLFCRFYYGIQITFLVF